MIFTIHLETWHLDWQQMVLAHNQTCKTWKEWKRQDKTPGLDSNYESLSNFSSSGTPSGGFCLQISIDWSTMMGTPNNRINQIDLSSSERISFFNPPMRWNEAENLTDTRGKSFSSRVVKVGVLRGRTLVGDEIHGKSRHWGSKQIPNLITIPSAFEVYWRSCSSSSSSPSPILHLSLSYCRWRNFNLNQTKDDWKSGRTEAEEALHVDSISFATAKSQLDLLILSMRWERSWLTSGERTDSDGLLAPGLLISHPQSIWK